ncbi:MAG TPA: GNAT family N-acetyltransferase [Bacteroidales bacterium]
MLSIKRTNSENAEFRKLNVELDKELAISDGKDHSFYAQYNKINSIHHVLVGYEGETPIACGTIKKYSEDVMEIKRMFVLPGHRGKGLATLVLKELELWAKELNFKKCILETGINQPDAIRLYKKNGYKIIPNYGQYAHVENSFCFEKEISFNKMPI